MIKEFEKNKNKFTENVKRKADGQTAAALNAEARADKSPVTAFAAVYRAVIEGLGLTPFDAQIEAGAYLDDSVIVELATGEGKTIAAVFAAYYGAVKGEHINIFTFNDYLAKRDALWMQPIYSLLGVSTAYITEDTPREKRRELYQCDVVYSTAKECGFDYLKDFSVFGKAEAVSGRFDRVIADEADSVLIDEARLPLVAAGSYEVKADCGLAEAFEFAKSLGDDEYEISLESGGAYLTPKGQKTAETHFNIENIYDEENASRLAAIGECLTALYVLSENDDYIVKDGRIAVIDKFTGRVSEEKHFPGLVHAAAELKHGLKVTERGAVIANIAIQYFIGLFKSVSGMTGTAVSSAEEFDGLYGLIVKKVEPNTPSRRQTLPTAVYYDHKSKFRAAALEVKAAYDKGQPVLVGTETIERSEEFSEILKELNVPHTVLNAKNDESEAQIVRNAGKPRTVTVSTNMTGRGVDIKLGGEDEAQREEAVRAGGLYVVCTFTAESRRINDQLYGRAARQGDVGQCRLFTSLDEEIMELYKLKKNVPERHYPSPAEEELTDKVLLKEVSRIQSISQSKKSDERKRLMEFNMINENHRAAVFASRLKTLTGENISSIWQDSCPEEYEKAVKLYGEEKIAEIQREAVLSVTNGLWSDYLEAVSELRDGIHLRAIAGKDPAEEYNIECEQCYSEMGVQAAFKMEEILTGILENGIETADIRKPKKTWTYLLADTADKLKRRTLAEFLSGEGDEEEDGYSEGYDELYGEAETDEAPEAEKKKGFFARLFGKKE